MAHIAKIDFKNPKNFQKWENIQQSTLEVIVSISCIENQQATKST